MKPRHKLYKSLREKIGARKEVSKLLGIHVRTLERREDGQIKISDEMVAALEFWLRIAPVQLAGSALGKLSPSELIKKWEKTL
jgi:hypothetical protein